MVIDVEELAIDDDGDGKLEWRRMIKVGEVHEKVLFTKERYCFHLSVNATQVNEVVSTIVR